MHDLNLTIVGNLTNAPELRYTGSGTPVCKFTVAHNPRQPDKTNPGKFIDGEPTFVDCTAWRQLAENIAESLNAGARVIVTGRLRTERWETDGQKRSRIVLDVTAAGPELAFATAEVKKLARNRGPVDDEWSNASRTRPDVAPVSPAPAGTWTDQPPY